LSVPGSPKAGLPAEHTNWCQIVIDTPAATACFNLTPIAGAALSRSVTFW